MFSPQPLLLAALIWILEPEAVGMAGVGTMLMELQMSGCL
jgi:hypothetical protein